MAQAILALSDRVTADSPRDAPPPQPLALHFPGGVIGLHGTNDPSSIGNRESHGCIRLYNRDIEKLVPLLPLGTPVVIR